MNPPLVFRAAVKEDLPQLVALINSAYRGDSSRQGWTTEADLLDGIRTDEEALDDLITNPKSIILLCYEEPLLLGCVYLKNQSSQMYLGMLTVKPELQARGIGKALLQEAERKAQVEGCGAIVMTVISVRTELIEWYERRGYEKTGERKAFPDDPRFGIPKQPLEFVIMQKKLEQTAARKTAV